jgi:hypothetical protein
MLKKLFFATVLASFLSMLVFAQEQQGGMEMKGTPAKTKAAKQSRLEGIVVRSNKDKSELTVRSLGTNVEKTVQYDSSTKWASQEHHSKKVNDIDASQVNDNDRVIVLGTWDKDVLRASLISKRLTPH